MSATEHSVQGDPIELEALPQFELSYLFDDAEEPTEVTVFPESDDRDISTNWITVAVEAAVPLERVR